MNPELACFCVSSQPASLLQGPQMGLPCLPGIHSLSMSGKAFPAKPFPQKNPEFLSLLPLLCVHPHGVGVEPSRMLSQPLTTELLLQLCIFVVLLLFCFFVLRQGLSMLELASHLDPSFCLHLLAVRSVFSYLVGKGPCFIYPLSVLQE